MKTIVIRPEIIAYHNSSFREPQRPLNKAAIACGILLPLVAIGGWLAGRSTTPTTAAAPAVAAAPAGPALRVTLPAPAAPEVSADGSIELRAAAEQGLVKADFTANGRDILTAELSNPGTTPIKLKVSFGQMFEAGKNAVAAARTTQIEIGPGKCAKLTVPTVAVRSANRNVSMSYRFSGRTAPQIDLLLTYAQDHPGLPAAALQTAVLALMENLPVSSVCKFTPAGSDLPSRFNTAAFRVDTLDILTALSALREIGVRDRDLAMTVDPQLKIESMIDPASRTAAMSYYGINTNNEWNYWKSELLEGDPSTRHYALYGIARFYPDVALEMLPKWAREKRTTPIFRRTAVQALAETQRIEALPMLQDLVDDLGRNTELGRAAIEAAQLLHAQLRKGGPAPTVAFRGLANAAPF